MKAASNKGELSALELHEVAPSQVSDEGWKEDFRGHTANAPRR